MAERRKGALNSAVPRPPSVEYNLLLTVTLVLIAFGAIMVFSASSTARILNEGGLGSSTFYLIRTLIAAAIGLTVMFVLARLPLARTRAMVPSLLAGTLVLLLAVLAIGTEVNGTKGWLVAGPIQIQPSEYLKVALILYGAYLFANRPERLESIRSMGPYLILTGVSVLFVLIQPDMGMAGIAVAAAALTLWVAGARLRDLGLLAAGIGAGAFLFALIAPYRRQRLLDFINPGADPTGSGFQVTQAKIAIGSGGLDGVGAGNGVQKAFYLPEAHTDMIPAVIGEEFGLIGMLALVLVFGLFAFAGLRIAKSAGDDFGRIIAAALTGLIIVQVGINLYSAMGMAPLTGVPLPLVSYGNNSLVVTLAAIGLILNVARGGVASPASRATRPGGGAKLRLVQGARTETRDGKVARGEHGRDRGRRDGGTRRARPGRRRRASG
jgi:cell division protein FtsW